MEGWDIFSLRKEPETIPPAEQVNFRAMAAEDIAERGVPGMELSL
jgi:hypothetical protein